MKTSTKILLTLFSVFLFAEFALAMPFKVRAREHFEIHTIERDGVESEYTGLSNTINVWHEKPYEYSLGLSISPLLGSAESDDAVAPAEYGKTIILRSFGVEGKYFFNNVLKNLYTRLGVGYSELRTQGTLPKSTGWNAYFGAGYEYPFKNFGLALEIAARKSMLDNGVDVFSITPSIGFHFYEML